MKTVTALFSLLLASACVATLPAQTSPVKPGIGSGHSAVGVGNFVYFANNTTNAIWRTDGTQHGTWQVEPPPDNPTKLWRIDQLTATRNTLYYLADINGEQGQELWALRLSDFTSFQVADLVKKGEHGKILGLTALGDRVLFLYDDGISGLEPWAYDPNFGAYRIADIRPGANWSVTNQDRFTVVGNLAFFPATDGNNDRKLWATSGTENHAWAVPDPASGAVGYIGPVASFGGKAWFCGSDDAGLELWSTDGSTSTLFDLFPGVDGINRPFSSRPNHFMVGKDKLFFEATNSTSPTGSGIWMTDGIAMPTKVYGPMDINAAESVPFKDGVIFTGLDNRGTEPWFSNGTSTHPIVDYNPGIASSNPKDYLNINDNFVVFSASSGNGTELHITDGTAAGTELIEDIYPGFRHSLPTDLVKIPSHASCDRLLFFATQPPHMGGRQLRFFDFDMPTQITIRISAKRIVDRFGNPDPDWGPTQVQRVIDQASSIWERNANIALELVEIVDLVDPGFPASWLRGDPTLKRAYETVAEHDPCRSAWRTDAVNLYLVSSLDHPLVSANAMCSRPSCPHDDDDIVMLTPGTPDRSPGYSLAHELGHYLELLHTHAIHEGPSCGCNGSDGGDCVADTVPDADPTPHFGPDFNTGFNAALEALPYTRTQKNLLRYNLLSYHRPTTEDEALLSCGQAQRARTAARGPRKRTLVGEPPVQITSVSFTGPRSLELKGNGLPAFSGGLAVRAGLETTIHTFTNPGTVGADFGRPITPGRHCVALLENGNVIGSLQNAIEVAPWLDSTVRPGSRGELTVELKSRAPGKQMFLTIGNPLRTPQVFPGIGHALFVDPGPILPLITDQSGKAEWKLPLSKIAPGLLTFAQAVEFDPTNGSFFTNLIYIALP